MSAETRGSKPASRVTTRLALVAILTLGLLSIAWLGSSAAARPAYASAMAQARPTGTLTIVGPRGARLYATPGGDQTGELPAGTVLTAVGRTADSLWVVVYNDAGVTGWVEVNEVVLFGIEELPVMVEGSMPAAAEAPSAMPDNLLPTPTATPLATNTPTPSPTPTSTPTPTPTPIPTDTPVGQMAAAPIGGAGSVVAVVRGSGAAAFRPARRHTVRRVADRDRADRLGSFGG